VKLLPLLLLACVLSLGVACSSEPAVPPTATPDVPTLSKGEVIGLVQGTLRSHSSVRCSSYAKGMGDSGGVEVSYYGERKWRVEFKGMKWNVYEGSNAVQTDKGPC
jgi:hypothetical protein